MHKDYGDVQVLATEARRKTLSVEVHPTGQVVLRAQASTLGPGMAAALQVEPGACIRIELGRIERVTARRRTGWEGGPPPDRGQSTRPDRPCAPPQRPACTPR